jgi:predicted extracellular nuclease
MRMSFRFAFLSLLLCACAHGAAGDETPVVDAGDGTTTIMAVRNGQTAIGASISVHGIVTDEKTVGNSHGFFIQDATAQSWAAIYVFVGSGDVPVATNDIVRVTGVFDVYNRLEEVDARGGTIQKSGVTARPAPVDVALNEIEPNGFRTMELQSMLVRVTNVIAATDTVGRDFTLGESSSGARITVTSYMANDTGPSPFPAWTGEQFTSITGHAYASGVAELAPMAATDVIGM